MSEPKLLESSYYTSLRFWINTLGEVGRMSPGFDHLLGVAEEGEPLQELKAYTTDREWDLAAQWLHLFYNDGRWRTFAYIDYVREETGHWLSTEFYLDPADEWTWGALAEYARRFDAEFDIMGEHEPNQIQVALNFDLTGVSPYVRDQMIARFEAATERIWRRCGVSVM